MSELRTDSTTDDINRLEDELRRLYASVIAPPSPARWTSPRMRFQVCPRSGTGSRTRLPRRVAAVALAAVAVLVVATLANRSPLAPQPVLAVQMQPAGSSLVCKLPISAV